MLAFFRPVLLFTKVVKARIIIAHHIILILWIRKFYFLTEIIKHVAFTPGTI